MSQTCGTESFDAAKAERVERRLREQNTDAAARMFKVFADETRMKIAYALYLESELCVCEVARVIGSTPATASHHLRLLHKRGITKFRKEGKMVYYSLDDDHVKQLIELAITHSREGKGDA